MADHLNLKSTTSIDIFMLEQGLKVSKETSSLFRAQALTGRTSFSEDEDFLLKELYLLIPIKTLARLLGRTSDTGVKNRMRQLGLEVPADIIEENKEYGRIKPGNVPSNKGKKMPAHVYKIAKRTMFRKGHLPQNTKHDGAITIRHSHKDRNNPPYKWIRISLGKWEMLHVHIWKKKYGPIPKGHIIVFKDKDTMNCKLSNLEMISMKQNMLRNSGSKKLSDGFVAGTMTHNDPDLRKELIKSKSPLIELKRKQIILNRKINAK